ncbi:hypothetical protein CFK39_13665 [Brachybacterium avium]|uniref:Uncharacterized protein n=1 Tax=Brachybacterium avium TaxID=2017485 RepID=A0A220UEM1_9MICO|nr:hypothetical protein [Brachybacterium avium]ASK66684.1 hypothetical protein CFK39_13665 [Brachybacterium avium]
MATRSRGRRAVRAGTALVAVLLTAAVVVYGVWAGYLWVFASEGAVPPQSRIPDLPAGTEIVGSTTECASGGCWREVSLAPAPHSSPRELAETLGLERTEQRYPWSLRDPHSVRAWADADGDRLVVSLRYWGAELTP